jgi:hypothetical protein
MIVKTLAPFCGVKPFVIMVEGLCGAANGVRAGRRGWRGRKTASVAGLGLTRTMRPPSMAAEREARASAGPRSAVLHDHALVCA